jgi:hypothetical protein
MSNRLLKVNFILKKLFNNLTLRGQQEFERRPKAEKGENKIFQLFSDP